MDLKKIQQRPMKECPKTLAFDGTLEELYDYAEPNFPQAKTVFHFHRLLRDYCEGDDPLFLVRFVTGTTRGEVYTTQTKERFIPTDNAPAWWMHFVAYNDLRFNLEEFQEIITAIPTHFYGVPKSLSNHINLQGWYVAHIYPVKNGDTFYPGWNREELRWRFLRNIHPCNHFYVPKLVGSSLGEDPQVIAYFAARYQQRYAEVWSEFLSLTDVVPADLKKLGKLPIRFGPPEQKPLIEITAVPKVEIERGEMNSVAVEYSSARLTFKYELIESLEMNQSFRVVTPFGAFQMTKKNFYETFANVVASRSYQDGGIYSYSAIPAKATRFRV